MVILRMFLSVIVVFLGVWWLPGVIASSLSDKTCSQTLKIFVRMLLTIIATAATVTAFVALF